MEKKKTQIFNINIAIINYIYFRFNNNSNSVMIIINDGNFIHKISFYYKKKIFY